jgi:hypothetical protein
MEQGVDLPDGAVDPTAPISMEDEFLHERGKFHEPSVLSSISS